MPNWFVYILECEDGSLYTGVTTNLDARLEKHKSGKGAKYTRSRGAKKMVYYEKFKTKSDAMIRECEIKSLTRDQKLELI